MALLHFGMNAAIEVTLDLRFLEVFVFVQIICIVLVAF